MKYYSVLLVWGFCWKIASCQEAVIALFNPSEISVGGRVTTTCAYSGSDKTIVFQWIKDNAKLEPKDNIQIHTYPGISVIIIDPIREIDNGTYSCQIVGKGSVGKSMAPLLVKVMPTWLKSPQDTNLVFGSNVTLECLASGFPAPVVTWAKIDGHKTRSTNNSKHKNGRYHLQKVTKEDQGFYECMAENGVGQGLVKRFEVRVFGELPSTN